MLFSCVMALFAFGPESCFLDGDDINSGVSGKAVVVLRISEVQTLGISATCVNEDLSISLSDGVSRLADFSGWLLFGEDSDAAGSFDLIDFLDDSCVFFVLFSIALRAFELENVRGCCFLIGDDVDGAVSGIAVVVVRISVLQDLFVFFDDSCCFLDDNENDGTLSIGWLVLGFEEVASTDCLFVGIDCFSWSRSRC